MLEDIGICSTYFGDYMISQLISKHRQLSSEIDKAIQNDEEDRVKSLDDELMSIWERILNLDPNNDEEKHLLADFLLTNLIEIAEPGEFAETIRKRILSLL